MIPISKPDIGLAEEEAVLEVLRSGMLAMGPKTKAFEEAWAEYCGVKHAILMSNGTVAQEAVLHGLGIGPGDEVITVSFSFNATVSVILRVGATPVFVDIRADDFCMDASQVEAAITPRTKAIMPVHLYGLMADMAPLEDIAKRHNLVIIEDAAQAHGAAWRGRPVGAIGDIGTFSFQSSKAINAGEGGMMVTNDPELDELLWSYRNVGRRRGGEWYEHVRLGWNLRITEFQAAVILEQLKRFPSQQAYRTEQAAYLSARLAEIPGCVPVKVPEGVTAHSWYSYHWRWLGHADGGMQKHALADALRAEGIPVFHGYVPLNRNAAVVDEIRRLGGQAPAACPNAERAEAEEILMFSMPILMGTRADLDQVVEAVAKVAAARA